MRRRSYRFCTNSDHVEFRTTPCPLPSRTSPSVRCLGRTDDMLVVAPQVSLSPSAVREVVNAFAPGSAATSSSGLGIRA